MYNVHTSHVHVLWTSGECLVTIWLSPCGSSSLTTTLKFRRLRCSVWWPINLHTFFHTGQPLHTHTMIFIPMMLFLIHCRENFEQLLDDTSFREELPNFRCGACTSDHPCPIHLMSCTHPYSAWTVNVRWCQLNIGRTYCLSWSGGCVASVKLSLLDLVTRMYLTFSSVGYFTGGCRSVEVLVAQSLEGPPEGGWYWDSSVDARAVKQLSSSIFLSYHLEVFYQVHTYYWAAAPVCCALLATHWITKRLMSS